MMKLAMSRDSGPFYLWQIAYCLLREMAAIIGAERSNARSEETG
jgi:hypothetical protein